MKKTLSFARLIFVFVCGAVLAGCTSQPLTFREIGEPTSLIDKGVEDSPPNLLVIALAEEINAPPPKTEFTADIRQSLQGIDFDKEIAVLLLVEQVPRAVTVRGIERDKDVVLITLSSHDVTTGNYSIKGFTPPYMLLSITKDGVWGKDITFVVKTENGSIVEETKHYIP